MSDDRTYVGVAKSAIDWLDAGWTVYKEGIRDPEFFPPLGDRDAQRRWLGGFGAAWVSDLDDAGSVVDALARVLEGRGELLRQLRSHTSGERLRTLH